MPNTLDIILKASGGDQVKSEIGKVSKETEVLTALSNKLGTMLSVGALAVGLKSCITAYGKSEEATVRLNSALRSQGKLTEETSKSFLDQAAALQSMTTFEDDAITAGQALAMSMGVSADTVRIMTPLVLDFAAATGKDLGSAFQLVGRAALGSTDMLRRAGIIIDEDKLKTEGFNAVLDKMRQNYKGTAVDIAKSGIGPTKQFANTLDDLRETIGEAVIPGLNNLLDVINRLGKNMTGTNKETEVMMTREKKISELLRSGNLTTQEREQLLRNIGLRTKDVNKSTLDSIDAYFGAKNADEEYAKQVEKSIDIILKRHENEKKVNKEKVSMSDEWKKKIKENQEVEAKAMAEQIKAEEELQDKRDEQRKKDLEAAKEAYLAKYESYSNLADQMMATSNSFLDLELTNIKNKEVADTDAAKERYENAKENIEKTITDEEDKATKLGELEKNYNAEIENIKTNADIDEKKRRSALKPVMIAQALANTAEGATKALAQGGVLGIITAALVAAAGMAQVATIEKQQFQGGGMVPGAEGEPVMAVVHGGERVLTPQQQVREGGGRSIQLIVNINGTLIEGDESKWDRLFRNNIYPSMQRLLQKSGEAFSGK